MPEGFYLTARDRELLNELHEWRGRRPLNQWGRPASQEPLPHAEETLIVLTPPGGIPAMEEPATGTGGPNVPGSAVCQAYRSAYWSGGALEWCGIERTVLNLSEEDIPGNTVILATKDKFGGWFGLPNWPPAAAPGGAYVALTPAGGLPGMNLHTTGTSDDEPGKATCALYRIVPGATPAFQATGASETVYSLAPSAVPANAWALAVRGADGNLVLTEFAGGYTGTRTVVTSVTCSGGTLTVVTATETWVDGRLVGVS